MSYPLYYDRTASTVVRMCSVTLRLVLQPWKRTTAQAAVFLSTLCTFMHHVVPDILCWMCVGALVTGTQGTGALLGDTKVPFCLPPHGGGGCHVKAERKGLWGPYSGAWAGTASIVGITVCLPPWWAPWACRRQRSPAPPTIALRPPVF